MQFMLIQLLGLVLIVIFPQIALRLPEVIYGLQLPTRGQAAVTRMRGHRPLNVGIASRTKRLRATTAGSPTT